MELKDFCFDLPQELIAQYPPETRGNSRLFVLDRKTHQYTHAMVKNLAEYLPQNSILVFNDSKVKKARLYAKTETGGVSELLLIEQITRTSWKVMATRAKRLKPGKKLLLPGDITGTVRDDEREFKIIEFSEPITETYMEQFGHIPLPPYIRRSDTPGDAERYQTVYAKHTGSIAAPTAGLHFTPEILETLHNHGIQTVFVTLHVGLGTFLPVRVQHIEDHVMHEEVFTITDDTARVLNQGKTQGKPIVAVGTTSLRALESAWNGEKLQAGTRTTDIFIYPGYRFNVVDALFTNFHTPESTLLMLVSAFAGREVILKAYQEAIEQKYRFFSYGDAMLIL